jgi:hypothetical protein
VYGPVPPDAVALNITGLPGVMVEGLYVKLADRDAGLMLMDVDEVAVWPLASVAFTRTLYDPCVP